MICRILLCILMLCLSACTLPRPPHKNLYTEGSKPVYLDFEGKKNLNVLVISGGGPNGAWGAGFINGWKDKPYFDVVTGISAGSTISTFAFLDKPEYSERIKDVYTKIDPKDILINYHAVTLLFHNSLNSSRPLKMSIDKNITNEVIDEVAVEGAKGRYLLVGTTSLDTGKFRLWDMTDLAAKKEYDKYRSVILASCSIPVVFEPVFIDGDMLVDGGLTKNVFVPPDIVNVEVPTNVYVLFNGIPTATGVYQVPNSLTDIAMRSVSIIVDSNSNGSLEHIHAISYKNKNVNFRMSCINDKVKLVGFDFTQEDLYNLYMDGFNQGSNPKWMKNLDKFGLLLKKPQ